MTQYVTTSSAANEARGFVVEARMAARGVSGTSAGRQATAPPAATLSLRKERRMKTNRIGLRHRCNPVTEFARRRRFLSEATAIRKLFTERLARAARLAAFAIFASWSAWADPVLAQPTITPLNVPPGGISSSAAGVDVDGSTVVGTALSVGDQHALRWDTSGVVPTLTVLGTLGGPPNDFSDAFGVSGDGLIVVGRGGDGLGPNHAFYWEMPIGPTIDLAPLPASTVAWATGANHDGTVIVGYHGSGAARWVNFGGPTPLPPISGGSGSQAYGVSGDGNIVVGWSGTPSGQAHAARWVISPPSVMNLGTLQGVFSSRATAVSYDGLTVVGSSDVTGGTHAFRWKMPNGPMQDLGNLPGQFGSYATGVSGNGCVVVGRTYQHGNVNDRAFLWSKSLGTSMVDLNDYLPTLGVILTGWILEEATGISADGTAIVGNGSYNGARRGWIVKNMPSLCCMAPPPNMVAWYTGDDTLPSDRLGQYPGTFVGSSVGSSDWKVGGGTLAFPGSGVHVVVPGGPNFGTGDFSIDMWVKTTANAGIQSLIDKRVANGPAGALGYALYLVNGTVSLQLANPANAHFNYNSSFQVADGNWHFVAVTVDRDDVNATGLKFYVDGNMPQTFDPRNRQGDLTNAADLLIGARQPTLGGGVFTGLMDEIEIFNRALTKAEVQGIYFAGGAGKCKYCPLCPPPKGYNDVCVGGTNAGGECAENSDCPGGGACNLKNRFITFEVPETGTSHGILVTLVNLDANSVATPGNYNGTERWVGPPTLGISDGSGLPAFNAAKLQCAFHSQDWSDVGELHIYGDVIVPGSTYEASVCTAEAGPCSEPLRIATAKFGDVVTPINTTNFGDVNAVLANFQNAPTRPSKTRADLAGSILTPSSASAVNFQDVSACVAAFQGRAFKTVVTAPPATCP